MFHILEVREVLDSLLELSAESLAFVLCSSGMRHLLM